MEISRLICRTLHELYMWPFAEGIKAGVGAVMTSYNEVSAYFSRAYKRRILQKS